MRLPGSGNEMWRKCIVNGGQMLRSEGVCGGARETFSSACNLSYVKWLIAAQAMNTPPGKFDARLAY